MEELNANEFDDVSNIVPQNKKILHFNNVFPGESNLLSHHE